MTNGRAHFLMVGDAGDLPMIQATLRRMPVDAYGQVFLEMATPLQHQLIDAPEGIAINWLFRDGAGGLLGAVPEPGSLAVQALDAWVSEWLPEPASDAHEALVMWIGCIDSRLVGDFYVSLVERMPHLHVHHPHTFPAGGEGRHH